MKMKRRSATRGQVWGREDRFIKYDKLEEGDEDVEEEKENIFIKIKYSKFFEN